MTDKLKISVITVCYNCVEEIERTLLSVLSQTYDAIEYIIIDGGSNDGTLDIIKKYSDRIKYWVSEPDNGIYDAMNKGITAATGSYLNFMNAGDMFVSCDTVSELFKHHTDESILYGNIIRCFNKYKERTPGITNRNPQIIDFINNTIHHQGAFLSKDLFVKYGLYSTEYKLMSDWKFFFEVVAVAHEKIQYVNQDIAFFYMNGASSNNKSKYKAECISYLSACYGEEFCSYLYSLKEFENCSLSTAALKVDHFCRNNHIIFKFCRYIKCLTSWL